MSMTIGRTEKLHINSEKSKTNNDLSNKNIVLCSESEKGKDKNRLNSKKRNRKEKQACQEEPAMVETVAV